MKRWLAICLSFPLLAAAVDAAKPTQTDETKPPAVSAPPMAMPPALPVTPPTLPATPPSSPVTPPTTDAGAAAIPQAFPRDRYAASWKKNPFLLKVAVIAQAKESWAMDYALTSIAKMSGVTRVSIKNKKTGESKRLTEGADATGEFKIVSVNLKPDRKSSSVEIERAGEKATLTYDTTMMTPQGRGAVPGQPGIRPGMPVIPGQPGGNVPLPSVRTSSVGGQGAMPGVSGNFPRPQTAAGNAPSYTGGGGGSYAGGSSGSANASAVGNTGVPNASRLGGVAPRTVAGGVGGGVTSSGATTFQGPGDVVINATDPTSTSTVNPTTTTTTSGATTPVTRRRTLIPAPVTNQ